MLKLAQIRAFSKSALRGFLHTEECKIEDLRRYTEGKPTSLADYPHASEIIEEVIIYDWEFVKDKTKGNRHPRELQSELIHAFKEGPGNIVIRGAWALDIIDEATEAYTLLIKEEQESGVAAGDHFGEPGANSRMWNSIEKLAVAYPDVFVRYFSNSFLNTVSEAWLGPKYQVTTQVNIVHPGGAAQSPHRDYHLGFTTNQQAEQYPDHVHQFSSMLTLQGGVAHCDMPIESGPTLLLPHSHKYPLGYLAWRNEDFIAYFDKNRKNLPLKKGDAVFFNPALLHAAGTNESKTINRFANLIQVNSAFGRSMETVDRERITKAIYPALLKHVKDQTLEEDSILNCIAASAEGYSFPNNLDRNVPIYGLAPESQAEFVRRALNEQWPTERFEMELLEATRRTRSH